MFNIGHKNSELLFQKYKLIYESHQSDQQFFSVAYCTKELTSILGGRPYSWRVVGITAKALALFKQTNFELPAFWAKRHRLPSADYKIQRAHKTGRKETTEDLLRMPLMGNAESFLSYWFKRDETILCGPGENRRLFDAHYVEIHNPVPHYFQSYQVGFQYREDVEGVMLKELSFSH